MDINTLIYEIEQLKEHYGIGEGDKKGENLKLENPSEIAEKFNPEIYTDQNKQFIRLGKNIYCVLKINSKELLSDDLKNLVVNNEFLCFNLGEDVRIPFELLYIVSPPKQIASTASTAPPAPPASTASTAPPPPPASTASTAPPPPPPPPVSTAPPPPPPP